MLKRLSAILGVRKHCEQHSEPHRCFSFTNDRLHLRSVSRIPYGEYGPRNVGFAEDCPDVPCKKAGGFPPAFVFLFQAPLHICRKRSRKRQPFMRQRLDKPQFHGMQSRPADTRLFFSI